MTDMTGKTVVVTGATSGIGQAAALALARMGARVVITARDGAKGEAMLRRLKTANPNAEPAMVLGDLSVIAGMKRAAEDLAGVAPRIDVLMNNAGAYFDHREVTADGLEKTFATNHLNYFVLTEILRPHLAPDARIVSTASGAHQLARLDWNDLQSARRYTAMGAYGLSKLCNILWTRALARRLEGSGVTANCMHPGGVNTNFGADAGGITGAAFKLLKPLFLTPEKGADTLVWLASAPEAAGKSGGYWVRRRRAEPSRLARDDDAAERLWSESARLTGVG